MGPRHVWLREPDPWRNNKCSVSLLLTFRNQLPHGLAHGFRLQPPPASKECHFHIDETLAGVSQKLRNDRVEDVLHPSMLDVIADCKARSKGRLGPSLVTLTGQLYFPFLKESLASLHLRPPSATKATFLALCRSALPINTVTGLAG